MGQRAPRGSSLLSCPCDFLLQSNIEDDPGSVAVIGSFYSRFVPGDGFNGAAQIMTPGVISFAVRATLQARLRQGLDFKLAKDEVFGVEQENQFIQPVDEQRDRIVALYAYLPAYLRAYLLR